MIAASAALAPRPITAAVTAVLRSVLISLLLALLLLWMRLLRGYNLRRDHVVALGHVGDLHLLADLDLLHVELGQQHVGPAGIEHDVLLVRVDGLDDPGGGLCRGRERSAGEHCAD